MNDMVWMQQYDYVSYNNLNCSRRSKGPARSSFSHIIRGATVFKRKDTKEKQRETHFDFFWKFKIDIIRSSHIYRLRDDSIRTAWLKDMGGES